MSAYGTKKRGGDFATQLTFPAVFSEVYASENRPSEYVLSSTGPLVQPIAGDDFQSHFHAQKKRDADYMATQKVISTRNARNRYLVSPHGYFGLPQTQLVQRIYANPSGGAQILSSSRRDGTDAPFQTIETGSLEGGVMRTAKGQAYGRARLDARIGQLNNIAAAKEMFVSGMREPVGTAQRPAALPSEEPVNAEIELNLLLSSIADSLMGAVKARPTEEAEAEVDTGIGEFVNRFTFGDATRAVSLIFRLVPSYGREDVDKLEDILGKIDVIFNLLTGLTDPDMDNEDESSALSRERLLTTFELFKRLREYMTAVIGKVDLSPKERKDFSKAMVKSLGFTKFLRDIGQAKQESKELFRRIADGDLFDERGRQDFDDDDDDDEDDGGFDRPATPREDNEQEGNDETFDEDERQVFGYQSGQFYNAPRQNGRAAPTFFGSDDRENARDEEDTLYGDTASRIERDREEVRRQQRRKPQPTSTTIRSVYDSVLGSRNVEVVPVLRSDQRSYASAKTATKPTRVVKGVMKGTTFAPTRTETQLRGQTFPPVARSVSTASTKAPKRKTTGIPSVRSGTTDSRRKTVPSGTTVSSATTTSRPRRARTETSETMERQTLAPVPFKSKSELAGMDRDALVRYAAMVNRSGGIDGKQIRINRGSTVQNIRRNFYRRLGYEGRK